MCPHFIDSKKYTFKFVARECERRNIAVARWRRQSLHFK